MSQPHGYNLEARSRDQCPVTLSALVIGVRDSRQGACFQTGADGILSFIGLGTVGAFARAIINRMSVVTLGTVLLMADTAG